MTHINQEQINFFHKNGFLSPIRVFSDEETTLIRKKFEQAELNARSKLDKRTIDHLHITHKWAWDLVHDTRIVDPISDILGPDILLWSMNWFIKEPGPSFVSYHQDATYWGLYPHQVATAWIALSEAGPLSGPMKFIPESHKGPLYEQEKTFESNNLLSRGQRVKTEINEKDSILAPLNQGEMSIHHVRTIHASEPNKTNNRRIGMVLRYCTTEVKQTKTKLDKAILVKGVDQHQNFNMIPRPISDMHQKAEALAQSLIQIRSNALTDFD